MRSGMHIFTIHFENWTQNEIMIKREKQGKPIVDCVRYYFMCFQLKC